MLLKDAKGKPRPIKVENASPDYGNDEAYTDMPGNDNSDDVSDDDQDNSPDYGNVWHENYTNMYGDYEVNVDYDDNGDDDDEHSTDDDSLW